MDCVSNFGSITVEVFGTEEIFVTLTGSYGQEDGQNPKFELSFFEGQIDYELEGSQDSYLVGEINDPKLQGTLETVVNLEGCLFLLPLT